MFVSETFVGYCRIETDLMAVTLRDIASYTNVSVSTVSRALNQQQYVDDATRSLVQRAAEELGYPLHNLRRKSSARTGRLISLLTHHDNPEELEARQPETHVIEQLIVVGARRILEQCGYETRIQHLSLAEEHVEHYVADPNIAGIILMGGVQSSDFIRKLMTTDLPFVVAGSHARPLHVNSVMADYRYGVEQVVAHLVDRGKRNIGLVNGPESTNTSREKYLGYRLGLALHDLDYSDLNVYPGDFSPEAGQLATHELLSRSPELDAIIYADDYAAMGGLRALKLTGRQAPDDVAVVGFHDYIVARYTDPPLTSVKFDMTQMGVIAARRLVVMLTEKTENAWLTLIPTSLVIRETT